MARSGHCQMLAHGADLGAQVGYRLGGITPDKSASVAAQEAQIDYRLGEESVDSRQVWFLGSGVTAEHLAYRPGERVTPADGRIVREAMFGIDRRNGERVRVRTERNRQARVAAAPYFSVFEEEAREAGVSLEGLWSGVARSAQLRALTRAAGRRSGTVVIRSAEALLRSNEHAWAAHDRLPKDERGADPLPIRFDRDEIMRRLGAHHRALHEAGEVQEFGGAPIDISLGDEQLGRAIWQHVIAQSQLVNVVGNAGYEMTLTCPKSFSVAAFVADSTTRDQWLEAVRDAAREATDGLMARVAHGRTGHEGDGQKATPIRGLGYAATVSIESYSREMDPHLHGHVMIPNRVVCVDGVERTMATGGADLVNHAWWFQAQFERVLRRMSVERGLVTGWEFDLEARQWEVAGANRDILAFYSQAQALVRAETLGALDGEGLGISRRQLQVLDSRAKRKVTRAKGEQTLTWGEVRRRMQSRALDEGISLSAAFAAARKDPSMQPGAWNDDVWARTVEEIVCENKGAEITARIEAAVRALAPHEWSEDQIRERVRDVVEREFTTGQASARGRVGVRKHASNRVTEAERRACEAFARGFAMNTHALSPDVASAGLDSWRTASGWAEAGRDFTPGQAALFPR